MVRNIFFMVLGLFLMIIIFKNVEKRLFSEKESFFWILGAFLLVISPLFLKTFDKISNILGVIYPPSLLFIILILFLLFLIFRISKQIYFQNERIKELSQRIAILNKYINDKNTIQGD